MAAAAAIQKVMPSRILGSSNKTSSCNQLAENIPPTLPRNHEQEQKERHFVTHYNDSRHEPLAPEAIAEDPKNKELGGSSSQLRLDDFVLLKTLGTGTFICCEVESSM